MKGGALGTLGAQLRAFGEAAGFTQEELATIAGVSVHAVHCERGQLHASAPAASGGGRPRQPLTRPHSRRHTSHRRTLQ